MEDKFSGFTEQATLRSNYGGDDVPLSLVLNENVAFAFGTPYKVINRVMKNPAKLKTKTGGSNP